ncbi:hypothetical protein [Alkalispirochaeta alkalica]|uniref:hypothetical protein n=1 Tax=Alkalispirochaeta alkalica TaxID=46356 RepID=UPI000367CDCA|nr:hypothetical protein [Alkalispirochaeta alkalica]
MPRASKDTVKQSVNVDAGTYQWIMEFSKRKGLNDYSAAVNFLLAEAREKIERQDRIEEARERMYTNADQSLFFTPEAPKSDAE